MAWRLKQTIFGVDLHVDVDTGFFAQQEIYEFRLKRKMSHCNLEDKNQIRAVIAYALKHLPENSFIILYFDRSEFHFLQFYKSKNNIVLDLPILSGNCFYRKEKELEDALTSLDFKRKYWKGQDQGLVPLSYFIFSFGKKKRSIRANFGKDNDQAAAATLLIAEKIFNAGRPLDFGFWSDKLIEA